MSYVVKIAPGLELVDVDPATFERNPLRTHALIEFHREPSYAPERFDAEGYLDDPCFSDQIGFDSGDGCWADSPIYGACDKPIPADDPLGLCPAHATELRSEM